MNYHARMHRGDLLLARAWLLVEGETDLIIFSELSRALDVDLYSKGVCCVEYSQVGCEPFIKLAKDFGIDWCLTADGGTAGNQYASTAKDYCDAATTEAEHIMQLSCENIEVLLCKNGFGHLYEDNEDNIGPQKRTRITAKKLMDPDNYWLQVVKSDEYWLQVVESVKRGFSKGRGAMVVVAAIEQDKTLIPIEIKNIINRVLSLAERCA